MDELARHNKARWEDLAKARCAFTLPWTDLTPEIARERVDPEGMMGDVADKDVFCLAGGGGQQSAAFAMLGARVTVLDLCDTQLDRDREAAELYGFHPRLIQGDMRDLSVIDTDAFDLVWHAHSLNFVDDAPAVLTAVARVLRPGGLYRLTWTNPFYHGVWEDSWDGNGYPMHLTYEECEVVDEDRRWDFENEDGKTVRVEGPREFRHTLSNMINMIIGLNMRILGLWEDSRGEADAEPGTWKHFKSVCPPWLILWARREAD